MKLFERIMLSKWGILLFMLIAFVGNLLVFAGMIWIAITVLRFMGVNI